MKQLPLILMLCLLPLSGCSAESPLPVSAAAISHTSEGYTMTAELIRQDSLDGNATPVYLTAEGESLPALFENANQKLGGHFYFSHAETVLIDISLAKDEGITELVDYLTARQDARLTLRLVVARGATADEILRLEALSESIPGVALYEMLEGLAQQESLPDLPLYKVKNALQQDEPLMLPCLYRTEDKHAAAGGFAVIENGKLSGFLSEEP